MSLVDPRHSLRIEHLKDLTVELASHSRSRADALLLNDHATGDLVSAEAYRDYLFDIHSEFAERLPCR